MHRGVAGMEELLLTVNCELDFNVYVAYMIAFSSQELRRGGEATITCCQQAKFHKRPSINHKYCQMSS